MKRKSVPKLIGTMLTCALTFQMCGQIPVSFAAAEEITESSGQLQDIVEIGEETPEAQSSSGDAVENPAAEEEDGIDLIGDTVPDEVQEMSDIQETEVRQKDITVEDISDGSSYESSLQEGQDAVSQTEAHEAPVSLTISKTDGTVCHPVWMELPESVNCQGEDLPVNYEDGICQVTVPEGTEELKIGVSHLSGVREDEKAFCIFFSRWGGYFIENNGEWKLYPDFLEGDTAVYGAPQLQSGQTKVYPADDQDGTYTLPLAPFELSPEEFTLEQQTVYGQPEEEGSYAEICIGSFDEAGNRREHMVILVRFEQAASEASDTEETDKELLTESGTENIAWGKQNSEFIYESEEERESEPQSGTEPVTGDLIYAYEMEEDSIESVIQVSADAAEVSQVYEATGTHLSNLAGEYIPQVGSMNGEWQILGLARSGKSVDSAVYTGYKANVVSILTESEGILHEKKYTEYSRVILALTAIGEDVTDVGGYNLLEPLADFDQTVWQGINGAIFALIAFDCHDYEIPEVSAGKTQNSREKLIRYILDQELSAGGWSMSGNSADPDVTAMAVQALAPYCESDEEVKKAVDRALAKLSSMQTKSGGFSSYGNETSESCAQVIVALTAAGIDPDKDSRFTKNGKSVLDALMAYAVPGEGFRHVAGKEADQMATEQAYYALAAYQRFKEGKNSLYDMSDVPIKSDREKAAETGKLIAGIPDPVTLDSSEAVKLALASYNGLNSVQRSLLDPEQVDKLQQASDELDRLQITHAEQLISAIGTVTLKKESKIVEANKAYHLLSSEQQKKVGNYSVLQNALETLEKLKETENSQQTEKPVQTEAPGQTTNPGQTTTPGQTGTGSGTSGTKTPGGSTKVVNLVTNSSGSATGTGTNENRVGGTAGTGAVSDRVGGTAGAGLSCASAGDTTGTDVSSGQEEDTEAEAEDSSAEGGLSDVLPESTEGSRSVIRMMRRLKLPELAEDYSQEDIDMIVEIYLAYRNLTLQEQKSVENSSVYGNYREALAKLGEKNHYDDAAGIDLRENPEESLPWYICLAVDPRLLTSAQEESIRQVLGEESEIFGISEIHFTSLLDGSGWQPENLLKVKLPMVDLGNYETAVIVHIRDDGKLEFLEGKISGACLEFEASEFSEYGIAGIMGTVEDLMQKEEKVPFLPWAAGGGTALLLLILVLLGKKSIRKEGKIQ